MITISLAHIAIAIGIWLTIGIIATSLVFWIDGEITVKTLCTAPVIVILWPVVFFFIVEHFTPTDKILWRKGKK